jgi:hypothetical protein
MFSKHARHNVVSLTYKEFMTKSHIINASRLPELRPSQFPICPILNYVRYETGHDLASSLKDYFCGVGTATHSVVQYWMGYSGRLLGDWRCLSCGFERKNTRRNICKKCRVGMEYVEFEVAYKGVTGHVDTVFLLDPEESDDVWVVDYKTSSKERVRNGHKYFPYVSNMRQLCGYAYILKVAYKMKVKGFSLLYIARDNPLATYEVPVKFTPEIEAKGKSIVTAEVKRFRAGERAFADKDLRIAYEHKPCRDLEHYDALMGEYKKCPFTDVCFAGKFAPLKRAVAEHVELIKQELK